MQSKIKRRDITIKDKHSGIHNFNRRQFSLTNIFDFLLVLGLFRQSLLLFSCCFVSTSSTFKWINQQSKSEKHAQRGWNRQMRDFRSTSTENRDQRHSRVAEFHRLFIFWHTSQFRSQKIIWFYFSFTKSEWLSVYNQTWVSWGRRGDRRSGNFKIFHFVITLMSNPIEIQNIYPRWRQRGDEGGSVSRSRNFQRYL